MNPQKKNHSILFVNYFSSSLVAPYGIEDSKNYMCGRAVNSSLEVDSEMILDVGSGAKPKGDVNVDLVPRDHTQYAHEWVPQKVKNFVLADAHFLPFRDKKFTQVFASHCLEHLSDPLKALKEMKRVCDGKIILKIPSQFNLGVDETHLYTWTPSTLKNLLKLVFGDVEVGYTSSQRMFGERSKLRKAMPFLNCLLSKLGYRPEMYAVCLIKKIKL